MLVWHGLRAASPPEPSVVTLGAFDGMHLGHRLIIDATLKAAVEKRLRAVLITFDPHPREVLRNDGERIGLLTPVEERIGILEGTGLDACAVLPFTRDLSLLDAEEFFTGILIGRFGSEHLVLGADHAFGRGREGRLEALLELGNRHNVAVTVVPDFNAGGGKVSSTKIRKALANGDASEAAALLGRPYRLSGVIVRGDGLGRTIGFPTANIMPSCDRKLIPKVGVYAAHALLAGGRRRAAMLNIGYRPTVSSQTQATIEAHIFDFDEDIYGVTVDIDIIERMRDEQRFESADALSEQLRRDEALAKNILSLMQPIR